MKHKPASNDNYPQLAYRYVQFYDKPPRPFGYPPMVYEV